MTVERCAFCDRRATTEAEIVPVLKHYPKGREQIKRLAVKAPVCARHAMAVNRDRGWQDRQDEARQAQQASLKDATGAAHLFDPDALERRRRTRRGRHGSVRGGGRRG